MKRVLIVDDESEIRESLKGALEDEGYGVLLADGVSSCNEILKNEVPDIILLDVWLQDSMGEKTQDGLELLQKIKSQFPYLQIIVMSGHGTIETAVKATKWGAFDFLEKPLSLDKLFLTLQNSLQLTDLARENESLRARLSRQRTLIGASPAIQGLLDQIRRGAPTQSWILITGENGTGKELVANAIHMYSSRSHGPFIEVNCAAIPEELIESELFGYEKGAFSGAYQQKRGRFEAADGGTLFLDEIGDMSLKTQAKILRILQEQRFERLGGSQSIQVDVRVVAATNKDLLEEIRRNQFREDLYYRLNVIHFHIPPLRERTADIPLLVDFFFKQFGDPRQTKQLTPDAIEVLRQYPWPGNVRELKNAVERLVVFSDKDLIDAKELLRLVSFVRGNQSSHDIASQSKLKSSQATGTLKDARWEFERDFILGKLQEHEWNVSKTAQVLGVERTHLHRKMKALRIDPSE